MTNSDAIQKAKELLGLVKGETSKVSADEAKSIAKNSKSAKTKVDSEKENSEDEGVVESAKEKNEKLAKAKEEYDEHMKKASELMSKAEAIKAAHAEEAKMWGSVDGDEEKKMPDVGTVTIKAEEVDLIKAEVEKGIAIKIGELDLVKAVTESQQKVDAITLLYQEEVKKSDELKKSFDAITGKLTSFEELLLKIGKSSNGPKSLVKANAVERFAPAKEGEKELSISRDKERVKAELIKAAGNDFGPNNIFSKAASCMEYAGAIGVDAHEATEVAVALRKLNGTILVG